LLKSFFHNSDEQSDALNLLREILDYLNESDTENFINIYKLCSINIKVTTISDDNTYKKIIYKDNYTYNISILNTKNNINDFIIEKHIEQISNYVNEKNNIINGTRFTNFFVTDKNKYIIISLERDNRYGTKTKLVEINYEIELNNKTNEKIKYHAIGAILHQGTTGISGGGHYRYASLKKKNTTDNLAIIQYIFDDSRVSVKEEKDNSDNQQDLYRNCYILLCRRA
jgi:hypothetical protein